MFSYDVRESFDTKNKHDDGEDDDIMMLITKIHHMLRNVDRCAGRIISPSSHWSLDVDKFWSTPKNSPKCLLSAAYVSGQNQKENSQVLGTREDKTVTFGK